MGGSEMSLATNWESDELLLSHLAAEAFDGRLTILLGSGVSVPLGLPDWETLVAKFEATRGVKPDSRFDVTRRAEYLQRELYGDDANAFGRDVRAALYRGLKSDLWSLRDNRTLAAVAALTTSVALANGSTRVITFNFDDLLEEYLRRHGCPAESVANPDGGEPFARVQVLHPHGLLPVADERAGSLLVFGRDSFSNIIIDQRGWRQKLLESMKGKTCLMIGLSGLDDHLDTLMMEMKQLADRSRSRWARWAVWMSQENEQSEHTAVLLRARGVHPKFVKNYDRALPAFLFEICNGVGTLAAR